jgi:hypothetical protein
MKPLTQANIVDPHRQHISQSRNVVASKTIHHIRHVFEARHRVHQLLIRYKRQNKVVPIGLRQWRAATFTMHITNSHNAIQQPHRGLMGRHVGRWSFTALQLVCTMRQGFTVRHLGQRTEMQCGVFEILLLLLHHQVLPGCARRWCRHVSTIKTVTIAVRYPRSTDGGLKRTKAKAI